MMLSVVIPTHEKRDLLDRTLAALRDQDAGADRTWEVVVVNDGCTDGTAVLLAEAAAQPGPPLKIVTPESNVGRARARNLGAQAATGRWILFLDDDIVAPPGLLAAHLDLLEAHPERGTIGWAVTDDSVRDAPHFHYLDTRGVAKLTAGAAPARYFVTQNAAVPRVAFLAVGGFDEEFASYGFEDMELAFRLEDQAGVGFLALPDPVPTHVHHHTLAQYLDKKVECGRASLSQLGRRHPGRLREMRLEHVLPAPGADGGLLGRIIRTVADGPMSRLLRRLVASWPATPDHEPRMAGIYLRLMDLLILCSFRHGLRQADDAANMTQ
ncbi:MAG: glycosyltransferase [bacterium]|nr:glycosyltransferase [bacterium]